jgi:FKBP-type peptidyl-prolyl cis-trans isomerase SlyD
VTETNLTVVDDLVVSMDYTLHLDDGEVVDTSTADEREPLQFLQGQGQIITGLEQALYGMAVGDEKDVVVAPVDAYGEREPDDYETVSPDVFPPDLTLEPGMRIRMRDDTGETFDTYVAEVRPDGVLLDFNHPLAGETLFFHVKIVDLRPATSEELTHGHAHEAGHAH